MSRGRRGNSDSGGRFPWGGLILILLGVLFLMNTLGFLPWGWWSSLGQLWPVILVLIGVYLLWGRTRPKVTAIAIVVILVAAIGLGSIAGAVPFGKTTPETFWEPLGNVSQAKVDIDFGAGDLTVSNLSPGSGRLVEGEFQGRGGGQRVVRELRFRDSTAELHLEAGAKGNLSWLGTGFSGKGHIRLTPDIPLEIEVTAGASSARLELADLRISNLRLDLGASKATVFLPKPVGTTRAAIKAGAADVDVIVPKGAAARIAVDSGLSRVRVDPDRFSPSGGFYVTQGYDQAQDRLEVTIEVGVASVEVR